MLLYLRRIPIPGPAFRFAEVQDPLPPRRAMQSCSRTTARLPTGPFDPMLCPDGGQESGACSVSGFSIPSRSADFRSLLPTSAGTHDASSHTGVCSHPSVFRKIWARVDPTPSELVASFSKSGSGSPAAVSSLAHDSCPPLARMGNVGKGPSSPARPGFRIGNARSKRSIRGLQQGGASAVRLLPRRGKGATIPPAGSTSSGESAHDPYPVMGDPADLSREAVPGSGIR